MAFHSKRLELFLDYSTEKTDFKFIPAFKNPVKIGVPRDFKIGEK